MIIPIKLARVKANGRRFIFISEDKGKVRTKGEVRRVSGFSGMHGPDKVFLADRVEILEVDLTEELLHELHRESDIVTEKPRPPLKDEPAPTPKVKREPKPRKKEDRSKRKWVRWSRYESRYVLTSHARTELWREGYGVAEDGLGNYLSEDTLGDAAMDCASHHMYLTRDGVKEGYNILREIAADYIHDGMQAALKKARAEGRKTRMEA